MKRSWKVDRLEDLESVAKELLIAAKDQRIFCFQGDLGAGKTV